jgi:hypothetical protein
MQIKVGTLVAKRYKYSGVGVITSIGSPNPIAKVLWCNGETSAIHINFLEVVCK